MESISIKAVLGAVGAVIANFAGGWDAAMQTLLIFMAIDYTTGLLAAAVFGKSPKSESGGLESKAGLEGLVRKGMMLLIVLVAVRLDITLGLEGFVRNAAIIAFIVNELVSIVENAGIMGVPMPDMVTRSIDILKNKMKEE